MNSRPSIEITSANIKAEARRLGFFACGVAKAEPVSLETAEELRQWIEQGDYAGMDYMARNLDKRLDPRLLMQGVRSIVSLAMSYVPSRKFPEGEYRIAAYALGQDYHDVIKQKLRQLAATFGLVDDLYASRETSTVPSLFKARRYRAFVDSGPVLERYWAQKAGLGWTGRNHQLIIAGAGSMFFLAELFLDVELDYDSPMPSHCGSCHRCIDACPTHAITQPKDEDAQTLFDAERCLSYQLIENRGDLSDEARQKMGTTIYGCDRCQQVCPWNRRAVPTDVPELQAREPLMEMTRSQWATLSEDDYRRLFKGSAVKRAKYSGLMRNIRAAEESKE